MEVDYIRGRGGEVNDGRRMDMWNMISRRIKSRSTRRISMGHLSNPFLSLKQKNLTVNLQGFSMEAHSDCLKIKWLILIFHRGFASMLNLRLSGKRVEWRKGCCTRCLWLHCLFLGYPAQ